MEDEEQEYDPAYIEEEEDDEITQEDAWAVILAYFEVRQQLDSLDEFIQNTMQEIVNESQHNSGHQPDFAEFELFEESAEHFNFDEGDFLPSRKGNFDFLVKHLQRVEIIGFEANSFASKHLLAMIKFLLGEALVLEKLIIKAELLTCHGQKCLDAAVLSKLLGMSRNVLSYQRASKNAAVIFDYPFD